MKNPGRIELTTVQVEDLIERIKCSNLSVENRDRLVYLVRAFGWMNQTLEEKSLSIARLRRLFGIQTEKASHILDAIESELDSEESESAHELGRDEAAGKDRKAKAPGHGRRGAEAYKTVKKVAYPHERLKVGMKCPGCARGKLCGLEPGKVLRIAGVAPLEATLHQPERLRCATCGEVYKATLPPEIGTEKYDASAKAMVAVFRYGNGMPMNRLENFQKSLGVPLPAGTQWELLESVVDDVRPVFEGLIQAAAQGDLFYNDDTTVKILSLMNEQKEAKKAGEDLERTGMFTTGIVSVVSAQKILLFFSGRSHAGENLNNLLARRADGLGAPLQMCDALSRNEPAQAETVVANCLTHGRRTFYDVYTAFPDQVKFAIGLFREVYRNDATAKKQGMSPEERLRYHQEKSGPVMTELNAWMDDHLTMKKVEPNSSLGKAMQYMRNHWEKLTRFLTVPGAPLTNDDCERLLKTAIRHRNNSLFYKTEAVAEVGDILMSLIQTATQAGANPFKYLIALQKNKASVAELPEHWFPWNYEETLASLGNGSAGPSP